MLEILHLHRNRLERNSSYFLLFIPLLVFLLTFLIFLFSQKGHEISWAPESNSVILGTQSEEK
jgi:hypothetical protein